ncbi:MAG: hypothetical protein PHF21_03635 [Bacilli bacterium]|nr:hypothetical protein [Bacilli bacterium]
MKLDTVVTLEGNEKYYLADKTIQNDKTYFLANKLDQNEEISIESCIFEEIKNDEDYYLDEIVDVDKVKYLTAVFTSNLISDIDELKED